MSVQVENLEKNMAKLTIEVPAEELEKALEKAYQKQKKNISVPGFRKGKVPRAMVEKMYGPAVFYEDAVNSLVPEEYSKAAEESKLDIVSRPEINVEQIEKGKAFIFTATVAVKPEVTLGEYKGLEVAKADTTVTDEEVEVISSDDKVKETKTKVIYDYTDYVSESYPISYYKDYIKNSNTFYKNVKGVKTSLKVEGNKIIYEVDIQYSQDYMKDLVEAGLVRTNGSYKDIDYISLKDTIENQKSAGLTCKEK